MDALNTQNLNPIEICWTPCAKSNLFGFSFTIYIYGSSFPIMRFIGIQILPFHVGGCEFPSPHPQ